MPKPLRRNNRYMPGLDGLRALAVLAVIAYHLNLPFVSGGLLGVGVFFVLSGYLITDILMAEWAASQGLKLKSFWVRRARRLLPAMLSMVLIVVLWVPLFAPSQVTSLRGDALSSVFYFSNWWFIFHKVSYFASFGLPSPLNHLWSLAVEEQFYIIWPLVLLLLLRFLPRRWQRISFTLLLATASALAMAIMFHPGVDPSRVYYGTGTRAFSLLIGAALAFVWPSRKLTTMPIKASGVLMLDIAGTTSLFIVLAMFFKTNEYQPFLYRGGMVLLSLFTAVLIAAIAHPATRLGKLIGCAPLRFVGARSYGIYLWHYPVIILTSSAVNTGGIDILRAVLQVAVSVLLAALSWRYLEEPIRHGALDRVALRLMDVLGGERRFRVLGLGSAVLVMILGALGWGIIRYTPIVNAAAGQHGTAKSGEVKAVNDSTKPANTTIRINPSKSTTNAVYQKSVQVKSESTPSGKGVTAIGDSIMVDVEPYLKKELPGIVVDGKIGRQLYQAEAVVQGLKAKNKLGQRVIIELGTNGAFTKQQLVSLLQSLGSVKQIVLVNTRVPRPWQNTVNKIVAQVAKTYPHTTLVNWYKDTAGKNAIFYPDGVHLKPGGSKYLASLLLKGLSGGRAV